MSDDDESRHVKCNCNRKCQRGCPCKKAKVFCSKSQCACSVAKCKRRKEILTVSRKHVVSKDVSTVSESQIARSNAAYTQAKVYRV